MSPVATTFEYADEIDLNRARLARDGAEAALTAAKDEKAALAALIAKAKLARAVSRIGVASKK